MAEHVVVNDQVLTPTYTKGLAEKIKELLQTEAYGLYHIMNSGECSWYEFADRIFELLGMKPNFGRPWPEVLQVYLKEQKHLTS